MNIDTFSAQLVQSLTARGIDGQTANTYVKDLLHTLTEEDLREISGYGTKDDFAPLSESDPHRADLSYRCGNPPADWNRQA